MPSAPAITAAADGTPETVAGAGPIFWDGQKFRAHTWGPPRSIAHHLRSATLTETVEMSMAPWRIMAVHRTTFTLTVRDTLYRGTEPGTQVRMEHLVLSHPNQGWLAMTVPTTSARRQFPWGGGFRRWHFANWEPHERWDAVLTGCRTALWSPSLVGLVGVVCAAHEDPPNSADLHWWCVPGQTQALADVLASRPGRVGVIAERRARTAALSEAVADITAARTMLALGAVRDYDHIVAPLVGL